MSNTRAQRKVKLLQLLLNGEPLLTFYCRWQFEGAHFVATQMQTHVPKLIDELHKPQQSILKEEEGKKR